MKASDYIYEGLELIELSEEKKIQIIERLEEIIDGDSSIQLYKIARIAENEDELVFMLEWLSQNNISLRGQNGTLESEFDNYERTAIKLGNPGDKTKYYKPVHMDADKQIEYFKKLDELKQKMSNGQVSEEDELEYDKLVKLLTEDSLRLVHFVVNTFPFIQKMQSSSFEKEDKIQWGSYALSKAVESFDINKGYAFSTYAVTGIIRTISREWVKINEIPQFRVDQMRKIEEIEERFLRELGRKATVNEISELMGMSEQLVETLKMLSGRFNILPLLNDAENEEREVQETDLDIPVTQVGDEIFLEGDYKENNNNISLLGSGDVGVTEDGSTVAVELDSDVDFVHAKMLREAIEKQLETLTPREDHVIKLRFGLYDGRPRTLEETGAEFGVSGERMRQIEAKALRKLRHPSRARYLRQYCDR